MQVDLRSANDTLLSRLDEAKRAHPDFYQRRDLLGDPAISALVNKLVLLNDPWVLACVKHEKGRMGLKDSVEELASTALAGKGGPLREVEGLIGAILRYDYAQFGVSNFTSFVKRGIHNALALTPKEARTAARMVEMDDEPTWVDRVQRRPDAVAVSNELVEVVKRNAEKLAPRQRAVARMVLDAVLNGDRRPTAQEVGDYLGVTKTRGAQLLELTFDRLKVLIEQECPDLAKAGVGGWQEFSEVFGKTRTVAGYETTTSR